MIKDIQELKALIKWIKKQNIKEFKLDNLSVIFFESDDYDQSVISSEAKEMLDKLQNDKTTDDDILMNPYAGLQE